MLKTNQLLKTLFSIGFVMQLTFSLLPSASLAANAQTAQAPTEPSCQSVATAPTWNPYPLTTNSPNPEVTSGDCKDMPILSFFPVDTENNNPRELNITENQDIDLHIYYNNGAQPNAGAIQNPTVAVELIKETETRFRVKAALNSSNSGNVTSAQKGGDLIINVPLGSKLDYVANTTRHFVDAIERKYESDTQGRSPSDPIADNAVGSNSSNPIYTAFAGRTLGSTSGYNFKPSGLEAGFLGYGYILSTISAEVTPQAPANNRPPQLPGQEVTVKRGQSAEFNLQIGTDLDGDYPLTYDLSQVPTNCTVVVQNAPNSTNGQNGVKVTCTTGANTPTKFTFPITPIDSKGLRGTAGIFVVNLTEDQNLPPQIPGQEITIIRGQNGSFEALIGAKGATDPENNTPIKLDFKDLPNFCTFNETSKVISCQSGANTPIKSTFTIIPTDSKGLAGTAGTFVVNIIDPDLNLTKQCFVKATNQACGTVKAGETVIYKITATNNSNFTLKNLKLVDTYDKQNLENISNIQPTGTHDLGSGTITWSFGEVAAKANVQTSFEAKVKTTVQSTRINNVVIATADGLPQKQATAEFQVAAGNPLLDTSDKTCTDKKTGKNCAEANLTLGSQVIYKINVRNSGQGIAQNVRVIDDYDQTRLSNAGNIQPSGTLDTNSGTITWQLGNLNAGETKTISFEATVAASVKNGEIIINTARILADNLPEKIVRVDFPVTVATVITPRTGGLETTIGLSSISFLTISGLVYSKSRKNKFRNN